MPDMLTDASSQLSSRPSDEHFATFADLRDAAVYDKQHSKEVNVRSHDLEVMPSGNTLRIGNRKGSSGTSYDFSQFAFSKLCTMAGAPKSFLLEKLTPQTAANAINESLRRSTNEDIQLLLGSVTGSDGGHSDTKLRAITSQKYCRVWDAELLHEVNEWLLPNGFRPALPTINTNAQQENIMGNNKPCLFRGDRNSFAFFMTDKVDEGHGGRPVRRGLLFGNSEVGNKAVTSKRFVFDDMCANFLIWNAEAVQSTRLVHRGDSSWKLIRKFRDELRRCSPELVETELEIMRNADKVLFADNKEDAAKRLQKQFNLTKAFAEQALEWANHQENDGLKWMSHAYIGNGVTSAAKVTGNADHLVEMATVGGDIFLAASES